MKFIKGVLTSIIGQPTKITDPFFGEMIDAGSHYECHKLFHPTEKSVEIGLEKKLNGVDDKQISFFNWLEEQYDLVIRSIRPSLEISIAEWIPEYKIENFNSEFVLSYLYIPKCDEDVFDWVISFYAENELQHWCTIKMNGLEVKKILIDG